MKICKKITLLSLTFFSIFIEASGGSGSKDSSLFKSSMIEEISDWKRHFHSFKKIGEGLDAKAYKVKSIYSNTIHVLKVQKNDSHFLKEVKAYFSLLKKGYKYIPRIIRIWTDGDFGFILMEYLESIPMISTYPKEKSADLEGDIRAIFIELYHLGWLHRDIHKGNIILTANGFKLIDFGRARRMRDEDSILDIFATAEKKIKGITESIYSGKPAQAFSEDSNFMNLGLSEESL